LNNFVQEISQNKNKLKKKIGQAFGTFGKLMTSRISWRWFGKF
jgi:hypothetical protein